MKEGPRTETTAGRVAPLVPHPHCSTARFRGTLKPISLATSRWEIRENLPVATSAAGAYVQPGWDRPGTSRMADLTHRRLEPEVMDRPDLDPRLHERALRGLARINALSLTARS